MGIVRFIQMEKDSLITYFNHKCERHFDYHCIGVGNNKVKKVKMVPTCSPLYETTSSIMTTYIASFSIKQVDQYRFKEYFLNYQSLVKKIVNLISSSIYNDQMGAINRLSTSSSHFLAT